VPAKNNMNTSGKDDRGDHPPDRERAQMPTAVMTESSEKDNIEQQI